MQYRPKAIGGRAVIHGHRAMVTAIYCDMRGYEEVPWPWKELYKMYQEVSHRPTHRSESSQKPSKNVRSPVTTRLSVLLPSSTRALEGHVATEMPVHEFCCPTMPWPARTAQTPQRHALSGGHELVRAAAIKYVSVERPCSHGDVCERLYTALQFQGTPRPQ